MFLSRCLCCFGGSLRLASKYNWRHSRIKKKPSSGQPTSTRVSKCNFLQEANLKSWRKFYPQEKQINWHINYEISLLVYNSVKLRQNYLKSAWFGKTLCVSFWKMLKIHLWIPFTSWFDFCDSSWGQSSLSDENSICWLWPGWVIYVLCSNIKAGQRQIGTKQTGKTYKTR